MVGFAKPSSRNTRSPHLFVANCGPALGLPLPLIRNAFESFGPVTDIQLADATGCRVIVTFSDIANAESARDALNGLPCLALGNRVIHIQFSIARMPPKGKEPSSVFMIAAELGIPGLFLYTDFVSEDDERDLIAAVDQRPWQHLSKRRVQHYGYEFQYKTRNVDVRQRIGKLPDFTDHVIQRISALPQLTNATEVSLPLDQLTVNEYTPGVGLSPHIDTHSAFEGAIISLSLAGTCIMEFRKYDTEEASSITTEENCDGESGQRPKTSRDDDSTVDRSGKRPVQRRRIFLPERSLLVLLGEARYKWHHYIPHHKVDIINERSVARKQRRVSFTFRKVRNGPCTCSFPSVCDSRISSPKTSLTLEESS